MVLWWGTAISERGKGTYIVHVYREKSQRCVMSFLVAVTHTMTSRHTMTMYMLVFAHPMINVVIIPSRNLSSFALQ